MNSINDSDEDYDDYYINFTMNETDVNGPAYATVALMIMILGTLANLFIVIYTITHRKTLKEPSTVFLLGLSISHLIGCCFYLPFPIVTAAAGEWVFGNTQAEKEIWCGICSFLLVFPLVNNLVVIACISIDRFLFITQPIKYKFYVTSKRAAVLLIMAFIFSGIYASVEFAGANEVAFSPVIFSCSPSWKRQLTPRMFVSMIFNFLIGIGIVLPTILTCIVTRRFILSDYMMSRTASREVEHHQKNLYIARIRNLVGIFGMLLLVYSFALVPYLMLAIYRIVFGQNSEHASAACFLFLISIHASSSTFQSYFRRDLTAALRRIVCLEWMNKNRSLRLDKVTDYTNTTSATVL